MIKVAVWGWEGGGKECRNAEKKPRNSSYSETVQLLPILEHTRTSAHDFKKTCILGISTL